MNDTTHAAAASIPGTVMTPRQIVDELDRHIVGQAEAKRAVAIALRNRWRRQQIDEDIRAEITPKNILMIGPTGVGKTEIARRLAKLARAPFIKVEATKFTEVGYVGKDVESIIRDLVDASVKQAREIAMEGVRAQAEEAAEERILDALVPPAKQYSESGSTQTSSEGGAARQVFRKQLREGKLDDKEVELSLQGSNPRMEIMGPPGMEEMTQQLQSMFQNMQSKNQQSRKVTIGKAWQPLVDEEAARLIDEDAIKSEGLKNAEENGIVFLDEIDKVCKRGDYSGGGDVSREGVQRDLLPLVEGSTVSTKYGSVHTDHILFIASGAFHVSKPSDLIPELQGRLPIRVELQPLKVDDFTRILTEPRHALTQQYRALMETEGVQVTFSEDGIKRLAETAWRVNEATENIGARRLHTVLERLMEQLAFDAPDHASDAVNIDAAYVDERLADVAADEDLSRYVL